METRQRKSEATRERILSAALALFAEKGFAQATMREIAARADCSLGLAYRYFKTKDAMVLTLYERMVETFATDIAATPSGTLAERWGGAMRQHMLSLEPHRSALMGLTSAGLTPGSSTQVLGAEVAPLRRRMQTIYTGMVTGARDAPKPAMAEALATLLYAIHLLLVLFWLQDATPGHRTTHQLIDFGGELLGRLRLLLRLPWFTGAITRLAGLLGPSFSGSEP